METLPTEELRWLQDWLDMAVQRLPFSFWTPYFRAGPFAWPDVVDALHRETRPIQEALQKAVISYAKRGRWPKLRDNVRFWVQGWLESALSEAEQELRMRSESPNPIRPPKGGPEAIVALVQASWDGPCGYAWLNREAKEILVDQE